MNILYSKTYFSTNDIFISHKIDRGLKNKIYDTLNQKRIHYKFSDIKKNFSKNQNLRQKLKQNFNFQAENNFEFFLKDIIWEIIPLSFIEGYKTVTKKK